MHLNPILVVALAALLLAAAAHAYSLQPGGQCVSQTAYMWYSLPPGWYGVLLESNFTGTGTARLVVGAIPWESNFTGTGTIQLIIGADVSSNIPVRLVIYDAQWQEIWATQPSTRIVGTYAVDLKVPGFYRLGVKNPSSATTNANATAILNITMCDEGLVAGWLRLFMPKTPGVEAPMGIVSYGVMEVGGRYFTYTLTTDAVRGVAHIPPNISVSSYYWNGTYYGQAFSVRLNAFVVAKLADGAVQYYRIQSAVGFNETHKGLEVWDRIWNYTSIFSALDKSAVRGNGTVSGGYKYVMPGSIPFGRVELEMWTRVDNGEIVIEFYANGRKYDEVIITPYAPATSAYIEIAPTTPAGYPMDLELILGEYPAGHWAVLDAGQIGLELYVRMNGVWVPPPSAWSAGPVFAAEDSKASVVPQGVGSVLVVPGEPNSRKLWAGTIIATPLGINATNSTDLSPYASLDLGNGTRLVLTEAYVNGRPAQLSSLSYVPLGSIAVLQYKRQYLVSISAPGNYTAGWFDEGSTIVINGPPVVDFNNGTRLVEPTLNGIPLPATYTVTGPANLSVSYVKQYLVTYSGPTWRNQTWINASVALNPPQIIDLGNGTRLVNPLINGTKPPTIVVDRPLVVVVSYTRQYLVSLTSPINNTVVWINASSAVVLNLPPVVDFGNDTRLADPLINGTRPPLVVEVDRPMSFVGTYVNKQYLVTYSGPTWLNRTWIDAGTLRVFNPPQIIDFGNNTRLIDPLVNGTKPPLSITVDKPISLSVEYTRQYLVSINTPFNKTAVWINAGASYAPPASAISTNGVRLVPTHLTIDGRRAPLAPVPVDAPLDITVHYNAYAEVPTTFAGLPALYAEASITCGGASNSTSGLFASSLRLELIDAPAGTCSISPPKVVPSLVLVVVAVIAAIVVLFRKLHKRS